MNRSDHVHPSADALLHNIFDKLETPSRLSFVDVSSPDAYIIVLFAPTKFQSIPLLTIHSAEVTDLCIYVDKDEDIKTNDPINCSDIHHT